MTTNYTLGNDWIKLTNKAPFFMQTFGKCALEFMVSDNTPDGSIYPHILQPGEELQITESSIAEGDVWGRSAVKDVPVFIVFTNKLV